MIEKISISGAWGMGIEICVLLLFSNSTEAHIVCTFFALLACEYQGVGLRASRYGHCD